MPGRFSFSLVLGTVRPALMQLLAAASLLLVPGLAHAVIVVEGNGSLVPSSDLPGFSTLGVQGGPGGAYLGIPIGPSTWIGAGHAGVSSTLFYQGSSYNSRLRTSLSVVNPLTKTTLVSGEVVVMELEAGVPRFSSWAPLWSGPGTLPTPTNAIVYGRGTARGAAICRPGLPSCDSTALDQIAGWRWGGGQALTTYGTGVLSTDAVLTRNGAFVVWPFEQPTPVNGLPGTASMLSVGDSSGAVFAHNASAAAWQLVGLNYAVDLVHSLSSEGVCSQVEGAVFNPSGFYRDANCSLGAKIPSDSGLHLNSYASSLATLSGDLAPLAVPAPLPFAALASAMAWARRLRRRIRTQSG
jgi:hypothetical protein